MKLLSAKDIANEIKAAQIEHIIGRLSFAEFMEIVGDLAHGQFGKEAH